MQDVQLCVVWVISDGTCLEVKKGETEMLKQKEGMLYIQLWHLSMQQEEKVKGSDTMYEELSLWYEKGAAKAIEAFFSVLNGEEETTTFLGKPIKTYHPIEELRKQGNFLVIRRKDLKYPALINLNLVSDITFSDEPFTAQ